MPRGKWTERYPESSKRQARHSTLKRKRDELQDGTFSTSQKDSDATENQRDTRFLTAMGMSASASPLLDGGNGDVVMQEPSDLSKEKDFVIQ